MKKFTAVYCGNGIAFNLICVFVPGVSLKCVEALVKQLHDASWYTLLLETEEKDLPMIIDIQKKD